MQNTPNTHKIIFNQISSPTKLCIITKKFEIKVTNNNQQNKQKQNHGPQHSKIK